jgi:oligopeptide/dipeptide ABC transporter ATP-binding protein
MYAGQVVEEASVTDIFDRPFHPYTRGLLKSIPQAGGRFKSRVKRLSEIPGTVPRLTDIVVGCKFADRCLHAFDLCREKQPDLVPIQAGHRARCWLKDHPECRRDRG